MIMRAVDNARAQSQRNMRTARVAAAAFLAFVLGGAVVYKSVEPQLKTQPAIVAPAPVASTDDLKVPADPWQSDELKDFGSVVQWETWGESKL
jgi:hypothetical protein